MAENAGCDPNDPCTACGGPTTSDNIEANVCDDCGAEWYWSNERMDPEEAKPKC